MKVNNRGVGEKANRVNTKSQLGILLTKLE